MAPREKCIIWRKTVARQIRIKVMLNKGRSGISLHKLPKLLENIQQFLDMLSQDVIGGNSEWLGSDFTNGSLVYTAERIDPVPEEKAKEFNDSFKGVASRTSKGRVRSATQSQYAKIANPIDADEVVRFGLEEIEEENRSITPEEAPFEWLELTKQDAALIAQAAQAKVAAYGSIQGIIHSVFFGAKPPHFQLRELSSGDLIHCIYTRDKYPEIAEALQEENAVLHVYGTTITDTVNREIEEMRVERIDVAGKFSKEDFEKFFGCAPGIKGELSIQEFIDRSRENGRQA
jgi:hypothetical protein